LLLLHRIDALGLVDRRLDRVIELVMLAGLLGLLGHALRRRLGAGGEDEAQRGQQRQGGQAAHGVILVAGLRLSYC